MSGSGMPRQAAAARLRSARASSFSLGSGLGGRASPSVGRLRFFLARVASMRRAWTHVTPSSSQSWTTAWTCVWAGGAARPFLLPVTRSRPMVHVPDPLPFRAICPVQ